VNLRLKRKNKDVRQRVIQYDFKPNTRQGIILDCLTYAASKLWNVANYERISWTKESGLEYPNWYDQKSRLKDDFWYKNLPSQSAQELLKQLEESWRSYYRLKNTGGIMNPKPPGYKHSNFNLRYLNNGFAVNEGNIRLAVSDWKTQSSSSGVGHPGCVPMELSWFCRELEARHFNGDVVHFQLMVFNIAKMCN
jgi:Probable transposase.